MAVEPPVRACRIGESAIILAFAGKADTGDVAVSLDGSEPARSFTTNLGRFSLVVAAFGAGRHDFSSIGIQAGERKLEARSEASLGEFVRALGLSFEQTSQLLFLLAGTVSKLFRLQFDAVLTRSLFDAARQLPMPQSRMQIFGIDGYVDCVLRCDANVKLSRETILLAFGKSAEAPSRHELAIGADKSTPPNRLTCAAWPGPSVDPSFLLLLAEDRCAWFEAEIRTSANAVAFCDEHMRHAPEIPALLLSHGSPETRSALLPAVNAEPAAKRSIAEPGLSFHFSIETLQAFDSGIFVAGWYSDPAAVLRGAEVIDGSLRDPALERHWLTYDGLAEIGDKLAPVRGFCAWLERRGKASFQLSPAIAISTEPGRRQICRAPGIGNARLQREAILQAIHLNGLEAGGLERAYRPALDAVARRLAKQSPIKSIKKFGPHSAKRSSIVIPLYGELRFLRSQLFAFAADRMIAADCEIIYVLDDPGLAREAEHRLASLSRIVDLDLQLVLLDGNFGYGPATNAGAGVALGQTLVLMNSDVVPAENGWLAPLTSRLSALPDCSVVGPKLLYADHCLQHAGMYFFRLPNGVFQNLHYYKGYGRDFAPANEEREVPAVTGAVMVMRRSAFDKVGGFSSCYVIGDYEDSDLCLKLRAEGGACHYVPASELYHFERQSMDTSVTASAGGSTAYNRHLHHHTWQAVMADLMTRPEFGKGANAY